MKNDNALTEKPMVKLWFFRGTDINFSQGFLDENHKINLQIFIGPRGGTLFGNICPRNVVFHWKMLYFHSPFDMHEM